MKLLIKNIPLDDEGVPTSVRVLECTDCSKTYFNIGMNTSNNQLMIRCALCETVQIIFWEDESGELLPAQIQVP